jgi:hypothetical protein
MIRRSLSAIRSRTSANLSIYTASLNPWRNARSRVAYISGDALLRNYHRDRRLLRPRRARPGYRTAEKGDELSPPHATPPIYALTWPEYQMSHATLKELLRRDGATLARPGKGHQHVYSAGYKCPCNRTEPLQRRRLLPCAMRLMRCSKAQFYFDDLIVAGEQRGWPGKGPSNGQSGDWGPAAPAQVDELRSGKPTIGMGKNPVPLQSIGRRHGRHR